MHTESNATHKDAFCKHETATPQGLFCSRKHIVKKRADSRRELSSCSQHGKTRASSGVHQQRSKTACLMEACEQPYMWLHICLNLLSIGAYRSERKEKKVAWNPEEAEDEEEEIPRTCWHRDPVAVFWHPGRVLNSELSSPANHKLSEKLLLQAQARPMEIAAKTQFFTSFMNHHKCSNQILFSLSFRAASIIDAG